MTINNESNSSIGNYFVDEAGDGTLFNSKGQPLIGTEGCSRFFILGFLDIPAPEKLSYELEELRVNLLADPYFKYIPSMQVQKKKTAIGFHAKDDIPEVRREVFSLLMKHELKFFAVIRDKQKLLSYVRQREEGDSFYRYHANELYDYLVRQLFRNCLHKYNGYDIYFAKRGESDRTVALKSALERTRHQFSQRWGITSNAPINIYPLASSQCPQLQATDYFLWALQRYYERREERYVDFIWSKVSLIHDLDDYRKDHYGIFYTQKNPLILLAKTL